MNTFEPCENKEDGSLPPITALLLAWYDGSRRILPWREDPSPYHVWLSEIMLQQTRVEAVIPYYERFLAELPDVGALAAAPEDRLLKLWEGLGYYSRVRNLQKAARQVMENYGGALPSDPKQLQQLAGIGPYTAAAIASIAFGVPVPSVDGNLLRVYARLTGYRENILAPAAKTLAEQAFAKILPPDRPGDMNQALMDLGATVCLPNGTPLCGACPVSAFCAARKEGLQARLPVAEKKAPRRVEKRTVLLIRAEDPACPSMTGSGEEASGASPSLTGSDKGAACVSSGAAAENEDIGLILLRKRPARGLLAGLWEFPNAEGHLSEKEVRLLCEKWGLSITQILPLPPSRHVFTHLEWDMAGYEVLVKQDPAGDVSSKKTAAPVSDSKTDGVFVPVRLVFSDHALPSAFAAYTALLR